MCVIIVLEFIVYVFLFFFFDVNDVYLRFVVFEFVGELKEIGNGNWYE